MQTTSNSQCQLKVSRTKGEKPMNSPVPAILSSRKHPFLHAMQLHHRKADSRYQLQNNRASITIKKMTICMLTKSTDAKRINRISTRCAVLMASRCVQWMSGRESVKTLMRPNQSHVQEGHMEDCITNKIMLFMQLYSCMSAFIHVASNVRSARLQGIHLDSF